MEENILFYTKLRYHVGRREILTKELSIFYPENKFVY